MPRLHSKKFSHLTARFYERRAGEEVVVREVEIDANLLDGEPGRQVAAQPAQDSARAAVGLISICQASFREPLLLGASPQRRERGSGRDSGRQALEV